MTDKSKIYSFLLGTGEKIKGSKESKEYNINCFLCTDDRQRLGINKKTEMWRCFNCNASGRSLKTLEYAFKNRKKVKNNVTIKKTEQEINCKIPEDFHLKFHKDVYNTKENDCYKYLEGRGITKEAIDYFKLGCRWEFGKKGKEYDAGDYLVIPYIKESKCVNVKYRKIVVDDKKNKWRREEGGVSTLYNDAVIDDFNYSSCIISESEIDTISIWEMGFKNVIGLTTGASGFKNKKEWAERLERFDTIYIVLDNDEAGQSGALELATMLGLGRCLNVVLPEGIKDPNDFLNSDKTKEDFKNLLDSGKHFEVRNASSLRQQQLKFFKEKFITKEREKASKYDTPWKPVNKVIGPLNDGYLFVLGGKPKCFKHDSTLIDGDTGKKITISEAFKNKTKYTFSLNEEYKISKEEITDWIDSGIKECFEVKTKSGISVSITECHKMLSDVGWKQLKDIKVGDYIAVPCFNNFDFDLESGRYLTEFPNILGKEKIGVKELIEINKTLKIDEIDTLINGHVGYTKIESIESIGKHQCYDLTIPSCSNLIVNDTVLHNCGKTSIAMDMMKHWAKNNIKCGIYSCEMRAERLQDKWLLSEPNIMPSKNGIDHIEEIDYFRSCLRIPSNNIEMFNPETTEDILADGVVSNCEALIKRYGLKIMVIDNLHYLCRGGEENAMISEATQKIKLMAERLDVMVVLITHPKKTNTNKQLKPEDLKGSSSIIQDADVIWLQHRPFQNDDMKDDEVKVGYSKHDPLSFKTDISIEGRFTEGGRTFLYFSGSYSTFKADGIGYNEVLSDFSPSSGKKKRKKRGL